MKLMDENEPSSDRGRGHFHKLNRSKISDVADINTRKVFLKRALPAHVLPPYHQGNGGSCHRNPRASGALTEIYEAGELQIC